MKKLILPLLVFLLLLCSCASTVDVEYLSPSEIDMGHHRNIAIASTVPFAGFGSPSYYIRVTDDMSYRNHAYITSSYNSKLASYVASYATDKLIETLSSSGYFNITPPALTDKILDMSYIGYSSIDEFRKRGIDAVIIPKIVSMSFDEYVYSEPHLVTDYNQKDENGQYVKYTDYEYYLNQKAYLTYSYTIVDVASGTVLTSKSFSDSRETDSSIDDFFFAPDAKTYFRDMINKKQYSILKQLVPVKRSETIELMSNNPKIKSLEEAYKAADRGFTKQARDAFYAEYSRSGHLPSGYNAALLSAGMGDIDAAITLLEELSRKYQSSDVVIALKGLQLIREQDEKARAQISGTSANPVTYSANDIFDVLRGV